MHDFIQSLSFQSQTSPGLARPTLDALRSVMRSFDDTPAFRPSPRNSPSRRRKVRLAAIVNHKS